MTEPEEPPWTIHACPGHGPETGWDAPCNRVDHDDADFRPHACKHRYEPIQVVPATTLQASRRQAEEAAEEIRRWIGMTGAEEWHTAFRRLADKLSQPKEGSHD